MTTWLYHGDALDVLASFPENSIDAVVTDAPYGLSREPDIVDVMSRWIAGEDYTHRGGGFMGKSWDSFVPGPSIWKQVLRVLKPGGHVLASFGTRTYDLGVVAMRFAGFEIRDQLDWLYGQGMAKGKDPGRAIDMLRCALPGKHCDKNPPRDQSQPWHFCPAHPDGDPWRGYDIALSPSHEPIALARKPLDGTVAENVLRWGTGALSIDACRIGATKRVPSSVSHASPTTGWGTGHSGNPGKDPNVGRWPANVLLDEAAAAMLDEQSGPLRPGERPARRGGSMGYGGDAPMQTGGRLVMDSGGASRFFYVAKASPSEREAGLDHLPRHAAGELTGGRHEGSAGLQSPRAGAGRSSAGRANTHPTVKPIKLMRYLVQLVSRPGQVVLDPFLGSGSTGCAAALEGRRFVGVEITDEYLPIAWARIEHAKAQT